MIQFLRKKSKIYDVRIRQNKFIDGQDTLIEIALFNLIMKHNGIIPKRTKIMFYEKFTVYTGSVCEIYYDVENNLSNKVFSSLRVISDNTDLLNAVKKGFEMYIWIPDLEKEVLLHTIRMVKEPGWCEKLYWPPKKASNGNRTHHL